MALPGPPYVSAHLEPLRQQQPVCLGGMERGKRQYKCRDTWFRQIELQSVNRESSKNSPRPKSPERQGKGEIPLGLLYSADVSGEPSLRRERKRERALSESRAAPYKSNISPQKVFVRVIGDPKARTYEMPVTLSTAGRNLQVLTGEVSYSQRETEWWSHTGWTQVHMRPS